MKTVDIHTQKIKTGYTTPEGYFDDFDTQLFKKIALKNSPKVIPFYQKRPVWMSSIAAVFVLGLLLTVFYKQNSTNVSADELTSYLIENQNISSLDMVHYLDETDLETLENGSTISETELENYLATEAVQEIYE